MKISVIGCGKVGSAIAYTTLIRNLADEIVLIDYNRDLAKGQALDMAQGQAFFPAIQIRDGGAADYADASLIVITAGAKQKPGESRLDLVKSNAAIIQGCIDEIVAQNSPAVVLIVSNPVDILTYVAQLRSGWPRGRCSAYPARARARPVRAGWPMAMPAIIGRWNFTFAAWPAAKRMALK